MLVREMAGRDKIGKRRRTQHKRRRIVDNDGLEYLPCWVRHITRDWMNFAVNGLVFFLDRSCRARLIVGESTTSPKCRFWSTR